MDTRESDRLVIRIDDAAFGATPAAAAGDTPSRPLDKSVLSVRKRENGSSARGARPEEQSLVTNGKAVALDVTRTLRTACCYQERL